MCGGRSSPAACKQKTTCSSSSGLAAVAAFPASMYPADLKPEAPDFSAGFSASSRTASLRPPLSASGSARRLGGPGSRSRSRSDRSRSRSDRLRSSRSRSGRSRSSRRGRLRSASRSASRRSRSRARAASRSRSLSFSSFLLSLHRQGLRGMRQLESSPAQTPHGRIGKQLTS